MKRLNKFLAESGIASRRGADKLILENKVLVNGKVAKLGNKVSERDRVVVNGQEINRVEEKEYFAVYKPVGYV